MGERLTKRIDFQLFTGIIGLGLVLILIKSFISKESSPYKDIDYDKILIEAAKVINKDCPIMINQETRLNNVMAEPGKEVLYNITLLNYDKDLFEKDVDKYITVEELRNTNEPMIINMAKTSPIVKSFRDNNVTMIYHYSDKNGVFLFEIIVAPDKYLIAGQDEPQKYQALKPQDEPKKKESEKKTKYNLASFLDKPDSTIAGQDSSYQDIIGLGAPQTEESKRQVEEWNQNNFLGKFSTGARAGWLNIKSGVQNVIEEKPKEGSPLGFPSLTDIRKKRAAGQPLTTPSIVAKTDTETVLMKEVRKMNKNCPYMVNKELRIDNAILLSDNTFQINYTVFNWEKDDMDIEMSKKLNEPKAISIVKNSPLIRLFRDNKVTVVYHYRDKNGVFLFETIVRLINT